MSWVFLLNLFHVLKCLASCELHQQSLILMIHWMWNCFMVFDAHLLLSHALNFLPSFPTPHWYLHSTGFHISALLMLFFSQVSVCCYHESSYFTFRFTAQFPTPSHIYNLQCLLSSRQNYLIKQTEGFPFRIDFSAVSCEEKLFAASAMIFSSLPVQHESLRSIYLWEFLHYVALLVSLCSKLKSCCTCF